ncbi:helix-turn-helix transcriptional regulator [Ornithinimicrobium cerasi]|uniref:helix-turn-helix transcriptional regulator n=1 Tax=Ornithinimicrobium cerasi TaxID=2248773 RepID=UPI000EFE8122|nr:helix-turn-helix transcriptional regulator [Ornithinimicrobium cerasi]
MKLKDRELLLEYMKLGDFSQARLGRYAGVSRQFINQLCTGERTTCTPAVADRIEEGLRVLPHTLFAPNKSHDTGRPGKRRTTVTAA